MKTFLGFLGLAVLGVSCSLLPKGSLGPFQYIDPCANFAAPADPNVALVAAVLNQDSARVSKLLQCLPVGSINNASDISQAVIAAANNKDENSTGHIFCHIARGYRQRIYVPNKYYLYRGQRFFYPMLIKGAFISSKAFSFDANGFKFSHSFLMLVCIAILQK